MKKLEAKAMEPEAQQRRAPRAVVRAVEPLPVQRGKRRRRDRRKSQLTWLEAAAARIDSTSPPLPVAREPGAVNPPQRLSGDSHSKSAAQRPREPENSAPLEPPLSESDAEPPPTQPVTASAASPDDLLDPAGMAQLIEVFTLLDRWARELEDGT